MSLLAQQLGGLVAALVPLEDWVAEQLQEGSASVTELKARCLRAGVSCEDIRHAGNAGVSAGRFISTLDDVTKEWRYTLRVIPSARIDAAPRYSDREALKQDVLAVIGAALTPPTAAEMARQLDVPSRLMSQVINNLRCDRRAIDALPAEKGTHLRYVLRMPPEPAEPAPNHIAPNHMHLRVATAAVEVAPPGLVSITAFGVTQHLNPHESISVIQSLNATLQQLLLNRGPAARSTAP